MLIVNIQNYSQFVTLKIRQKNITSLYDSLHLFFLAIFHEYTVRPEMW
jgi:hypothetical protein